MNETSVRHVGMKLEEEDTSSSPRPADVFNPEGETGGEEEGEVETEVPKKEEIRLLDRQNSFEATRNFFAEKGWLTIYQRGDYFLLTSNMRNCNVL